VALELESVPEAVLEVVNTLPFVQHLEQSGKRLLMELDDPDSNRPELVKRVVEAGGRVMSVTEKRYSLEEVYLTLIREEESRDA
jgi:hypothetical protein